MPEDASETVADHPRVMVFPPIIPIGGFAVGVLLQALHPADGWLSGSVRTAVRVVGVAVLVFGAAGFAWMVRTMKRARTPIHTSSTPTRLVETGPFARTRNPMYLCGSIAYAGLALLLMQPWSLALLPAVVAITHYGVVLREEAFLEGKFGDAYRDYRTRVPRWL